MEVKPRGGLAVKGVKVITGYYRPGVMAELANYTSDRCIRVHDDETRERMIAKCLKEESTGAEIRRWK